MKKKKRHKPWAFEVDDRSHQGKFHLGTILTLLSEQVFVFWDKDEEYGHSEPLMRLLTHMAGDHSVYDDEGIEKTLFTRAGVHFREKYPGLKKTLRVVRKKLKKLWPDLNSIDWAIMAISFVGYYHFNIPLITCLNDKKYFFDVKKDCLKSFWEEVLALREEFALEREEFALEREEFARDEKKKDFLKKEVSQLAGEAARLERRAAELRQKVARAKKLMGHETTHREGSM